MQYSNLTISTSREQNWQMFWWFRFASGPSRNITEPWKPFLPDPVRCNFKARVWLTRAQIPRPYQCPIQWPQGRIGACETGGGGCLAWKMPISAHKSLKAKIFPKIYKREKTLLHWQVVGRNRQIGGDYLLMTAFYGTINFLLRLARRARRRKLSNIVSW